MPSVNVVVDIPVCQFFIEFWFVMNNIQMVVNEILLQCPVVPINKGVDLGTKLGLITISCW